MRLRQAASITNRVAAICFSLATTVAYGQSVSEESHALDAVTPSWLQIGGQLRARLEAPAGPDFVARSGHPYVLTRVRLNVAVTPLSWLKCFAEAQDTRALGYHGSAPAPLQNPLDLRAAYLEAKHGDDRGAMLRVGRQEMAIGSSRLISIGPWSNTSKSFDAVRAAFYRPAIRAELIAGSIVQVDGSRFDRHKAGEHFFASYNTIKNLLVPNSSIEPYLIAKVVTGGVAGERGPPGDAVVYTGGFRWTGTLSGGIDYSAEMLRQWGSWAADTMSAYAATYTLGWKIDQSNWQPRLSADYSFGSGDRNPNDGRRGALDLLYGASQPFFSYTGMISWRNLYTLRTGVDFSAGHHVKAVLDYRDFRLATVADGLYNSTGIRVVLNRKADSHHVGYGPDAHVVWTVGSYTEVTVGVAKIYAGAYLNESGKPGGYLYPYLMWARRF